MSKEIFKVLKTNKGLTDIEVMKDTNSIELFEAATDVIAILSQVITQELDQYSTYRQKKLLKKLVCDAVDNGYISN